ncbi:single-stranded DNA-binding protein [Nonlabens spongiae]|uniref:Single-stranded DNA-binding protein n=1 Tax=Nonlabens spongiae TaxID=331648 RepID=A0A1W6MHZ0_9FLAO|nr:single-stranded DNA-binding protein [Nonlabens spongiae]ARN77234.1 single-stranded DNA-binding protein [Nonlabens spongiae]
MSTMNNKVQLIGNLGQDPEIINLQDGKKLAKFSLATTDRYKNKQGEQVTDTQWHRVVAFNGTANIIASYVKKGNKVGVEGKLVTRAWDDKDGNKRYTTEVVCNEVLMLGGND